MTKVRFSEAKDEISIDIRGHASYAPKGEDIVCAAISMLGQTLLAYLETDHEDFRYIIQDGRIWAWAKGPNVQTALKIIMTGFWLLEQNYPDHIEIERGCSIQKDASLDIK